MRLIKKSAYLAKLVEVEEDSYYVVYKEAGRDSVLFETCVVHAIKIDKDLSLRRSLLPHDLLSPLKS